MRRLLFAALAVGMLAGCSSIEMAGSHMVSATQKLNRTITVYAMDGTVIRSWSGPMYLEVADSGVVNFMLNGKRVTVRGTFVAEEN